MGLTTSRPGRQACTIRKPTCARLSRRGKKSVRRTSPTCRQNGKTYCEKVFLPHRGQGCPGKNLESVYRCLMETGICTVMRVLDSGLRMCRERFTRRRGAAEEPELPPRARRARRRGRGPKRAKTSCVLCALCCG